jgi:hypothetical protein
MLSRITLTVQRMNQAHRDAANGQSAAKDRSPASASRPLAGRSPAPALSGSRIV